MTSDAAQQRFLTAAQNKEITSAYLVICSRQSVAKRLADAFLMRLFCKQGGCGICVDCKKVIEGHVDILHLHAPKVAAFREALSFIAEKAYDSVYKAVVVENADEMTDAAANSMLKTLEQPPKNTVIILLARSASGVLPTVSSRCTAVHISPDTEAETSIMQSLDVDETTAHILKDLSAGFLSEAVLIHQDTAFWDLRLAVLTACQKLLVQKGMAISAFADLLEQNKETILLLLCVMQSYYRDILVYQKTQNADLLINRDKTKEIENAASHFTSGAISNIISVILESERRFFFSVNFRLAIEKMLFDILEEKGRWKKS